MSEPWTVGKVVVWATDDFRTRGFDSPRLEAELLLGHVLTLDRIRILIDRDRPLSAAELAAYKALIVRRRSHEPVAYLLGQREFFGRAFRVDRRVLIPRPDTETLVEVALERLRGCSLYARVLDLCTGSGCVAISLAKERLTWRLTATDASPDALTVARDNAHRLGAHGNVAFLEGDLFDALPRKVSARPPRFEAIVSNPPYIPDAEVDTLDRDVRDHEPRLALAGGRDGLDLVRRIVDKSPDYLVPGGLLALEIMMGQSDDVAALLSQRGFAQVQVKNDYGGIPRVVSGLWPG
jgi:release factor glutamine methyltransferase